MMLKFRDKGIPSKLILRSAHILRQAQDERDLRYHFYQIGARGWFVLRDGSYEPPQDERDNFKYPEDPEQALLVEGHERNKALTLSPVEGVEPFERLRWRMLSLIYLTILLSLAAQQAHAVPQLDKKNRMVIVSTTTPHATNYYKYFVATFLHMRGDLDRAESYYEAFVKQKPHPQAYQGFFETKFALGKADHVIRAYEQDKERFDKHFANNLETQMLLAHAYLNTKQEAQAEKLFIKLAAQYPDDDQVAYFATIAYINNNQFDKALSFLTTCFNNPSLKSKYFLLYFLQSKIMIHQQKFADALHSIEKSLSLFPKFDRALLFKAILYEQLGKANDAIAGYKSYLEVTGGDTAVERQLVQLLFAQQRVPEALEYLKRVNARSPEHFFDQAVTAFTNKEYKQALKDLDKALSLRPIYEQAILLKAEILLQENRTPELLRTMQDWLIKSPDYTAALQTFMLLRKTTVPVNLLTQVLSTVAKKKPSTQVQIALADLYADAKDYVNALTHFKAIAHTAQDNRLKARALFHISHIHFQANQVKELEESLKQALATQPVYPSSYNLLAYHYGQSKKNLPQALELIEKALDAAPECPYYLDTKGYILLQLGRRQDAIATFKQALDLSPDDTIIKNHLKNTEESIA